MRVKTRTRPAFRHLRSFVIVGVLLVIAAALAVGYRAGFVSLPFLSKIPEYTIVPVQRMFNSMALWFENRFADKRDLEAEIIRLQNELRAYMLEEETITRLKQENEELRSLLDFKEGSTGEYIAASVIAMAPGNWFSVFTLDKGLAAGVDIDMTVLSPQGLIGRVSEVTDTYCVVKSIIDGSSAVAGIVERTRDHVVVKGAMSLSETGDLLQMAFTSLENELIIGDKVLTSGMDGIFPKGVMIGQVKSISTLADGTRVIALTPSVDFKHIEHALILSEGGS